MSYTQTYRGVPIEAIVAKGDELLGGTPAGATGLSDWITEEALRLEAERQSKITAPATAAGVDLVIGDWYDVTAPKRWSKKIATRYTCQYRGRSLNDPDILLFAAWGKAAAKKADGWQRSTTEDFRIGSIEKVVPIEAPVKIVALIAEREAAKAEREARLAR